MGTAPTLSINKAAFGRALNKYANEAEKAIKDTYNSRMLDLVIKANFHTPKANRAKIISEFRRMGPAIVAYRRELAGKGSLNAVEMKDEVKRVRGAVLRSLGFVRSGWVPAMRAFSRAKTRMGGKTASIRNTKEQFGADKGFGKPATKRVKPVALAVNTVPAAAFVGQKALARALAEVTAGMTKRLKTNLQKVTNTHWNRVRIPPPAI